MPRTGLTPEEVKGKALEEAEALICKVGPERVRLSDVARALGVSHAALYRHFADKEALFDEVSRKWLEGIDRELGRIAGGDAAPTERITAWFSGLHRLKLAKVKQEPQLYAAFELSASRRRPFVEVHLRTAMTQLESLISAAMEAGELRKGNPAQVATLLFEATAAFHHPRLVFESLGRNRLPALRDTLKVLLAGLR